MVKGRTYKHNRSLARRQREHMAQEILKISEQGFYRTSSGKKVLVEDSLSEAIHSTVHYQYSDVIPMSIDRKMSSSPSALSETHISVVNSSSVQAALNMPQEGAEQHIGILNFASGTNPGGGFLWGAGAQEESLCYSSLLHPCLAQFQDTPNHYYQINRLPGNRVIYTDCAIFSPNVPIIRDSNGALLENPRHCSFVTIPAPKASANHNQQVDQVEIARSLKRRIQRALQIFLHHGCTHLVLGAFGCGAYGNDVGLVANEFRVLLEGPFKGKFRQVVFAILTRFKNEDVNFQTFQAQFPEF